MFFDNGEVARLFSFFPVRGRILVISQDGLNDDGTRGILDGKVSGIGEAIQQGKTDIFISNGTGEWIFFNAGELFLQVKIKDLTEAFTAIVVIINSLLDLPEGFGSDQQLIFFCQASAFFLRYSNRSTLWGVGSSV